MFEVVVVGASWGGLHAVGRLLAGLPSPLGAAVIVAQHRGAESTELADLLARRSPLLVTEADDKDAIVPDHVYVAPPEYHLLVEPGRLALSVDERVHFARPSIDVLFESAADAYGERVIGVVLTGANEDGAAGLARVKERGGFAIVQDPEGAERAEMPRAALAATLPDAVVPLDEIGPLIARTLRAAGDRQRAATT